jgi:hypothetical protein
LQKINPYFLDATLADAEHRARRPWLIQAIVLSAAMLFLLSAFAYELQNPISDFISIPSADDTGHTP